MPPSHRPGSRVQDIRRSVVHPTRVVAAVILVAAVCAGACAPDGGAAQQLPSLQDTAPADTGAPVATPDDTGAVDPEADAEPLTGEQAARDEAVRNRLQALFDRIGTLQDVRVEVEAGIVRLDGTAQTQEARDQAVELARQSEGVLFVEDRLRTVTSFRARLDPALNRIRNFVLDTIAALPLLAVALATVLGLTILGGWVARLDGPHLRVARTPFLQNLLRQGIHAAFGIAGILLALELLDATALVGAVLGTAGVVGLAVGFAFRDIVENHLAGIMLSFRQPFAPNDHIVVDGHEGKVIRLTARETVLMTLEGNHLRIPNAQIYGDVLVNYSRNPRRRFDFEVAVGNAEDPHASQVVVRDALRGTEGVLADPEPAAQVAELGDSWVTLHVTGWMDQRSHDFLKLRSEAIRVVKNALEAAGIDLPSPEYSVVLREVGARPRRPHRHEERQDVSVDRTLDDQIEEERRQSDERDLLSEDGSG